MWSAVFLVLFLRKEKSGKRVSEKTAKWQKGKERLMQIATYRPSSFSFDVFIVFIHLPWVLKLKMTRKLSNEIMNINY